MSSKQPVNFVEILSHDDKWLVNNASNIIQQLGGLRNVLEILSNHDLTHNHTNTNTINIMNDSNVNSMPNCNNNTMTDSTPLVPTAVATTVASTPSLQSLTISNINTNNIGTIHNCKYQPVTSNTPSLIISTSTPASTVVTTPQLQSTSNSITSTVIGSSSGMLKPCGCKRSTVTAYPLNDGLHLIAQFLFNRDCITSNFDADTVQQWSNMIDIFSKFILSMPFCTIYGLFAIGTILIWYLEHEKIFVIENVQIWIIFEICWLIQTILLLLCFDRELFYQQLQSFDVWYRFYNMILCCMCDLYLYPNIKVNIMSFIVGIPAILFMTCVDALPVLRKTRLIVFVSDTALGCLFYATFYFGIKNDVEMFIFERKISLKTLALGAMSNIAIFTIKQLYHFVKDPTKATNVSNRPKLIVFGTNMNP